MISFLLNFQTDFIVQTSHKNLHPTLDIKEKILPNNTIKEKLA